MMNALKKMVKQRQFRQQQEQYRLGQGRLTAAEAAAQLSGEAAIPLVTVQPDKGEAVTVGMDGQPFGGHLLVMAPPTGCWVDQIMYTLSQWPDAALVVDTGGKLHGCTGHFRQKFFGPVYTLPGYKLDLGRYYRFWNERQARKLHGYLMPPYSPEDRQQIERSTALFTAVGHYAYARKRNALHVLLDVASCDLLRALAGLETVPHARFYVRQFSKGQAPEAAIHDPDVVQVFSLFARQLQRYQDYYDMFDTEPEIEVIPQNWVQQRGTLYLTFDQIRLTEIGGLVTAVVAGLVRHHLSHGDYKKLLLVLDVDTAGQIRHFTRLLQMVADYGITVILLAPSWPALCSLAGEEKVAQFAGHFSNQLWYPPHDEATAQQMSQLLGSQLGLDSATKEPVSSPEEILAWPSDEVLVLLRRERPYRFIGKRLTLPMALYHYQAPLLPPVGTPAPRHYLDWLPSLPAPPLPQKLKALAAPVEIIVPQKEEKQPQRRKKQGLK